MALYVPQNAQLPSIHMNTQTNYAHQSSGTAGPKIEFANKTELFEKVEGKTNESPSDECFTIGLSLPVINFVTWNGAVATLHKTVLDPPSITNETNTVQVHNLLNGSRFVDSKAWSDGIDQLVVFLQYVLKNVWNAECGKKIKKNSSKTRPPSMTIVVSPCFTIEQKTLLLESAKKSNITIKNIVAHDLALVAFAYHEQSHGRDPWPITGAADAIILVVSKLIHCSISQYILSLIQCEGNADPVTPHVERMVVLSRISTEVEGVSMALAELINNSETDQASIKGILYDDVSIRPFLSTFKNILSHLDDHSSIFVAAVESTRGGCLVTAAELDSSKEYVQNKKGVWGIVYQLTVGDGKLDEEIGISIAEDKTISTPADSIDTLFKQSKVSKLGHGLLRPLKGVELTWKKEFKRKSGVKSSKIPSITLYSRRSSTEPWTPFQVIYPLETINKDCAECLQSCVLKLSVDPHTGTVTVTTKKGLAESEIKKQRNLWFQIAASIIILLLIPLSYLGYTQYQSYSLIKSHEQWLSNFYLENAPEKLTKDPLIVTKTIQKYKGRMFLLWRNLEKTYRKKIAPPPSIVETEL